MDTDCVVAVPPGGTVMNHIAQVPFAPICASCVFAPPVPPDVSAVPSICTDGLKPTGRVNHAAPFVVLVDTLAVLTFATMSGPILDTRDPVFVYPDAGVIVPESTGAKPQAPPSLI